MIDMPPPEELIEKVKALQQRLDSYRALIENAQDLFYRTDLEGRISFISPSVHRLSGYTVEEAIGKGIYDPVVVEDWARERLEQIFSDGVCDYGRGDMGRPEGM